MQRLTWKSYLVSLASRRRDANNGSLRALGNCTTLTFSLLFLFSSTRARVCECVKNWPEGLVTRMQIKCHNINILGLSAQSSTYDHLIHLIYLSETKVVFNSNHCKCGFDKQSSHLKFGNNVTTHRTTFLPRRRNNSCQCSA